MRTIITIILSLIISNSYAQHKKLKSEIGISLFSHATTIDGKYTACNNGHFRLPFTTTKNAGFCNFTSNYYYPKVFFSTKLGNYFNFRAAFQFSKHKSELWQTAGIEYFVQANRTTFSEGIQYNFFKAKRFSPYIAIDIALTHSDYSNRTINNKQTPYPRPITDYGQLKEYVLNGFLSIGANYKLTQRFSSSIEISTDFNNQVLLPGRLSINYHF